MAHMLLHLLLAVGFKDYIAKLLGQKRQLQLRVTDTNRVTLLETDSGEVHRDPSNVT